MTLSSLMDPDFSKSPAPFPVPADASVIALGLRHIRARMEKTSQT